MHPLVNYFNQTPADRENDAIGKHLLKEAVRDRAKSPLPPYVHILEHRLSGYGTRGVGADADVTAARSTPEVAQLFQDIAVIRSVDGFSDEAAEKLRHTQRAKIAVVADAYLEFLRENPELMQVLGQPFTGKDDGLTETLRDALQRPDRHALLIADALVATVGVDSVPHELDGVKDPIVRFCKQIDDTVAQAKAGIAIIDEARLDERRLEATEALSKLPMQPESPGQRRARAVQGPVLDIF